MRPIPDPFRARALVALLVVYLLVYLPLASIAAYIEGVARGMWAWSTDEMAHQLRAHGGFLAWLVLSAPAVVVLLYLGLSWIARRERSAWLAAPAAMLALFIGTALVGVVVWSGPLGLLRFPVAFYGVGACYGLGSYSLLRRTRLLRA